MSKSYVASTAILKCSCGGYYSVLTISKSRRVTIGIKPVANISDNNIINIHTFGTCMAQGKSEPCSPCTPNKWMNGKNNCLIQGSPALLDCSYLQCLFGGIITLLDNGQSPLNAKERIMLFNCMKEIEDLTPFDNWYDRKFWDFVSFIPVLGSLTDAIRCFCKGNSVEGWVNVVFLVADVVTLLTTGGTGTIISTAIRYGYKGYKIAKILSKYKKISPVISSIRDGAVAGWKAFGRKCVPVKNALIYNVKLLGKKTLNNCYKLSGSSKYNSNIAHQKFKIMSDIRFKKWRNNVLLEFGKTISKLFARGFDKRLKNNQDEQKDKQAKELLSKYKLSNMSKVKTGAKGITRIPPKECTFY